ncbi:MAG: UDP-N-acetylmuramoyl-L-alanyl-D-glutamate--2,6-diaminopimelate ligase [Flavobacterium sp.]
MKILQDILYKVRLDAVQGSTQVAVRNLHFDSRKVGLDDVFIAIRGVGADGHLFIEKAVNAGAIAIICEEFPTILVNGVTYVKVSDSAEALAWMASNYYDQPSTKLKLVGITGTNGKTTVASLCYQLFQKAGYVCGLLSTVKVMVGNETFQATHTTPDPIAINHYLNEMVQAGVTYCFMEVSSHGIQQNRITGLDFDGAVFTNLTHDHLDYHKTFAAYRDVKKSFFDGLPKNAFALTNIDDKNGEVMVQNSRAKIKSYALKSYADYRGQVLESQLSGLLLKINEQEVWVKLIGQFNAYNLLAIYGIAIELGMTDLEALRYLSELESVSGRFQYVISPNKITAIVDYAHTPDALQNVIDTINDLRTKNESFITIVGCGGDRDKAKRPEMAAIAANGSTQVILTSDNPRTEDPMQILKEMEAGVPPQHFKKVLSNVDREQAIKMACQMAKPQDIILIAGKGHENYQEINGVKHPFDDMEIVKKYLNQ